MIHECTRKHVLQKVKEHGLYPEFLTTSVFHWNQLLVNAGVLPLDQDCEIKKSGDDEDEDYESLSSEQFDLLTEEEQEEELKKMMIRIEAEIAATANFFREIGVDEKHKREMSRLSEMWGEVEELRLEQESRERRYAET